MISTLLDHEDASLRRKALELLTDKLASLYGSCPTSSQSNILSPTAAVTVVSAISSGTSRVGSGTGTGGNGAGTPPLARTLDVRLETGLIKLTNWLTRCLYTAITSSAHTSSSSLGVGFGMNTQLCLTCLRDLARLLAGRYPGEFVNYTRHPFPPYDGRLGLYHVHGPTSEFIIHTMDSGLGAFL
ncbi:unnamed protein product [Protopolystoma xenopodis]|uniref:Uncharacterized protein n=1 Tax=Protopolystoma xenopodis TaxID=117903 RepID=A0A448WPZ2_9PLAT|nr:unnamed protein product [Protopolystoma xenopodis]